MKVLILTNIPSPYRVDFFNELNKYCDLTVIYERKYAKNRENKWLKNDSIKFNAIYLKGIKYGDDSSCSFQILKYLKDRTFDLILISGYSSITDMIAINYLHKKKIDFIFNCDGGIVKSDNAIIHKIKSYFISKPKYWLSTGKMTDDYLCHYGANKQYIYRYPFTSIKKNEIIQDKLSKHNIDIIKDKLGIFEDKVCITVGQFIYRKGFDILIKSAQFVNNNIGIYIIGGTPTKEYLKLVDELKLKNVHFVGFKDKNALCEYYKIADLFVLPTREDIWGLVINEAMAFGLPIITTNKCVAGIELVEDNVNGYIISVDDYIMLSKRINEICNNDKLRNIMYKNNINKIKQYTIENMVEEYINIFNEILKVIKK